MFWKHSKKPTKLSNSSAFVRQDSRTTVETNTAQSESSSTSMYSDTIFNENNNTVAFRTTTRTITHQQKACVTEINKRYTPTPEELAEMRAAIFAKTESSSNVRKPGKNLIITKNIPTRQSNNNPKKSPLSPLVFSYDSLPHSYSTKTTSTKTTKSDDPQTPTIVTVEKTDATQTSGSSVTSRVEQHRIKLGGNNNSTTLAYSTVKDSSQLNTRCANDASKVICPMKKSTPQINKQLVKLSSPKSGFESGSCSYKSPYLNRSTTLSTPVISSATPDKEKPTTENRKNEDLKAQQSKTLLNSSAAVKPIRKKAKLLPGHVYIFNNEIFDNPTKSYRVGSSADVELLRTTFETFKMKVHLIENAKLEKIDSTVKKIACHDFSQNSCLVFVILSHGARHETVSAKDGSYSIDDKILFPVLRNRTLADKPKIMFIQACKGGIESHEFVYTDSVQLHESRPDEILKCYSTFEGYVSYRSENGSIFIQTVCEFLKLFGEIKNIADIMELVKLRVKQKSNGKQIPAIMSTLTQPYVFGDYF